MSAIAQFVSWQSLAVTGSDRQVDVAKPTRTHQCLLDLGCTIYPQDGSGVTRETDGLVVSTAIESSNPDIAQATALGIPVFHRSDVLASIVRSYKTIAVAGTSGKSTVTALIYHLLESCGRSPSVVTGAGLHSLIEQGLIGNAFRGESDLLVVEADESDGTLVKYEPYVSLFLNVSKDHHEIDETIGMFKILAKRSTIGISNRDDSLLGPLETKESFGLNSTATCHASQVGTASREASATVDGVHFSVPLPGRHNACNLLAALSVCRLLGCNDTQLAAGAKTFRGIHRRFDRFESLRGVTIVDDYAHNPEKIRAALLAAQSMSDRVWAIFQPHGFGPLRFMMDELVGVLGATLRPSDTLFLSPVYYVGGTALKNVSSADVAAGLASTKATVQCIASREEALPILYRNTRAGDVVLSLGARDPSLPEYAASIAKCLDSKTQPAGSLNT